MVAAVADAENRCAPGPDESQGADTVVGDLTAQTDQIAHDLHGALCACGSLDGHDDQVRPDDAQPIRADFERAASDVVAPLLAERARQWARRITDVRAELRFAVAHINAWREQRAAARAERDAVVEDRALQADRYQDRINTLTEDLTHARAEVERLRAELVKATDRAKFFERAQSNVVRELNAFADRHEQCDVTAEEAEQDAAPTACDCSHCTGGNYDKNPTRSGDLLISNPTHPYNIHPELDPLRAVMAGECADMSGGHNPEGTAHTGGSFLPRRDERIDAREAIPLTSDQAVEVIKERYSDAIGTLADNAPDGASPQVNTLVKPRRDGRINPAGLYTEPTDPAGA